MVDTDKKRVGEVIRVADGNGRAYLYYFDKPSIVLTDRTVSFK